MDAKTRAQYKAKHTHDSDEKTINTMHQLLFPSINDHQLALKLSRYEAEDPRALVALMPFLVEVEQQIWTLGTDIPLFVEVGLTGIVMFLVPGQSTNISSFHVFFVEEEHTFHISN